MKEKTKVRDKKIDEPMGEMIEDISNSIRKKEIQNQILRKIILEIDQKLNKKS